MQWSGRGLIIGVRRHGESGVIVEAMVAGKGRHSGLVRGGRSSRHAAILQPGNAVQLSWRARLDEHLGNFTIELEKGRAAALIENRMRLFAAQTLCDHLRLLPERDPHDRLLQHAEGILDGPDDPLKLGAALAFFELILLEELGFGLDIETCALTGATRELSYVSPRTGRAVTEAAAGKYKDRLLKLPSFLSESGPVDREGLAHAFALTQHFLDMDVWMARQISPPSMRAQLVVELTEPV